MHFTKRFHADRWLGPQLVSYLKHLRVASPCGLPTWASWAHGMVGSKNEHHMRTGRKRMWFSCCIPGGQVHLFRYSLLSEAVAKVQGTGMRDAVIQHEEYPRSQYKNVWLTSYCRDHLWKKTVYNRGLELCWTRDIPSRSLPNCM